MNFRGMFRATALLCVLLLGACAGDKSGIRVINASTTVYEVPSKTSGTAVAPIAQSKGRGSLILHGGGTLQHEIATDFIALAGPDPRLCLIDTADGQGQIYRLFDDFRGIRLTVLNLQPSDAGRPDVVAALRACTGFFFGGGNPQRLSDTFRPRDRDTPALAAIRERFEKHGAVVAGSSAGAMAVGPVTLCECGAHSSVLAVTRGELFRAPGFDLLNEPVLIDAHFFSRGLLGRHMFALARDHIPVGVGIDEDTAVLVPGNDGPWVVLAGHKVALVKTPSDVTMDHLHGFGFSELFPDDRFDPVTGRVMVSSSRRKMGPTEAILEAEMKKAKDAASIPIRYSFGRTSDTVPYVNSSTGDIETYLNRVVSVDPL